MDDHTEPNNCTGTNWYGGTRFWYDIIWFGTWYEILVRNSVVRFVFGLLVRDFRTGTKWFGSVRIFQKIVFFSNRTVYEPTYLVRNRFGPIFRKNYFYFLNQFRTGPITYQISWFVIGSVRKISFSKNTGTIRSEFLKENEGIHGLLYWSEFLRGLQGSMDRGFGPNF